MKHKKILVLFLIILFAVLQNTALNYIRIFSIKPDLLLILVIFFALYYGQIYGMTIGALCGLFGEATSGIPTGIMVLAYSFGGLVLGHIGKLIYNRKTASQLCISFVFTLSIQLLLFVIFQTRSANLSFLNAFIFIILPASFYTAGVSPWVFIFLKTILNIK